MCKTTDLEGGQVHRKSKLQQFIKSGISKTEQKLAHGDIHVHALWQKNTLCNPSNARRGYYLCGQFSAQHLFGETSPSETVMV